MNEELGIKKKTIDNINNKIIFVSRKFCEFNTKGREYI